MRYYTPDENDETRDQRNQRFAEDNPEIQPSPPLIVPPSGRYMWDWYFEISGSLRRVRDGVCEPVPPSEFLAWREASGNIVYPSEYAILRAMDAAYCAVMNTELADYRAREEDRRQRENPQLRKMGYR